MGTRRAQHTNLEVGMCLCLSHLETSLVWPGPKEKPSGKPESPSWLAQPFRKDLILEVPVRAMGGKPGKFSLMLNHWYLAIYYKGSQRPRES